MTEQMHTPHDWIKSTLGHGETMCRHCFITNREAAVLGLLNECDKAPKATSAADAQEADWLLVPRKPSATQLEQAASNLADEFGADFVLANKQFALAVYDEMLAASPAQADAALSHQVQS